ncbi:hypothetical protein BH11CYA1_BH11CYA1_08900 [soil metagenome]
MQVTLVPPLAILGKKPSALSFVVFANELRVAYVSEESFLGSYHPVAVYADVIGVLLAFKRHLSRRLSPRLKANSLRLFYEGI